MISFKRGKLVEIRESNEKICWLKVNIDGEIQSAVNYVALTGMPKVGDTLILNTTAVELNLGTGGQHFVIGNEDIQSQELSGDGHIMKLRYTPMQLKCMACEEEDSPHYEKIKGFKSLENSKFIVGTLHSMVAPISAHLKRKNPKLKINYIMTDGGALPIDFSKTVTTLKEKGIVDSTITVGQSFGGDYETVNIYTGLIVAKEVLKSDITIIAMGPGIAGTGTKYGFSGIEQGAIADAVNSLGGKAISVPRISFADARDRHRGISHHSITIFKEIMNSKTDIVFPMLGEDETEFIKAQIREHGLRDIHNVYFECGDGIKESLDSYGLKIKTMGRGYDEDRAFFETLGAVANYASRLGDD